MLHIKIVQILAEDNVKVGHRSVIRFLKCYQGRQSLEKAPRSGRPTGEVTLEMMNFLDTEMERNDEVTAPELTGGINNQFETRFSQPKIKRLRQKLGWVCTKTKYWSNWSESQTEEPKRSTANWSESQTASSVCNLVRNAGRTMSSLKMSSLQTSAASCWKITPRFCSIANGSNQT